MDYSCQDIPMRLDIRYQPLNFDIYLSQVIEVPRTSAQEEPYNFQLETEALEIVDRIIERTQKEGAILNPTIPIPPEPLEPIPIGASSESCNRNINNPTGQESNLTANNSEAIALPPPPPHPSCPTETPLTPVKSSFTCANTTDLQSSAGAPAMNQINLRDFEDIHYNPFDHLELQTIDELRELDLVFQASYANQASNSQLQPTTNDNPNTKNSNTITKS